jgi:uncharacterized protein YjiS (DUF1127 family)
MIRSDLLNQQNLHADNAVHTLGKLIRSVGELPVNVLKTIYTWQRRADERRQLSELSDHMLNDMGITRRDARREFSKSFWLP